MRTIEGEHLGQRTRIREYRPQGNGPTRFLWDVGERATTGSIMDPGYGGNVRTLKRATAASRAGARRLAGG